MRHPSGDTTLATAPKSLPGFTEREIVLPQRLWTRLEQFADDSAREPSEVVAEALRLLFAGALPAASASVSGIAAETDAAQAAAESVAPANAGNVEIQLADVGNEPLDSERLLKRVVQVMAGVDTRDGFTASHSRAVADLALSVAKAVGVEESAWRELELAALAHDLGKMRIPEEVLGKRGRLSGEEWALVKQYPEFGAEMLAPFANLAGVRGIIGAHQERWDGSGYPRGLSGDAIPLGAQIVGICDVYNVLTSERSYRPALGADTARRTIESGIDRLWSPDLARKLLDEAI
jgi:HD-GYP domain-containing protein (c-di-GMP phosphodiesterase class II)